MSRYCFLFISLICFACQDSDGPFTSFYYWKTTFKLSPEEKSALVDNNVKRLYVRYLDVVLKDDVAIPESPIVFAARPEDVVVIPVVYIKNEVMLKKDLNAAALAEKVIAFIQEINDTAGLQSDEIQIDCDWSDGSKAMYFEFLEQLKLKSKFRLSATIRLHQIKYHTRTGIPPVARGVLMYYNMGKISADESNSIYERSTAARYLDNLSDYPLPLDVALPFFSWGVHIRDNRVIGLVRDVDIEGFQSDKNFENVKGLLFEVKESTFKKGYRYQQGDRIKIESITREDLDEMASDLHTQIKTKPSEVIFYDLDKLNLKPFEDEKHFFQEISDNF
jgi:hypothetical protein